jgi:hypothetical protein
MKDPRNRVITPDEVDSIRALTYDLLELCKGKSGTEVIAALQIAYMTSAMSCNLTLASCIETFTHNWGAMAQDDIPSKDMN